MWATIKAWLGERAIGNEASASVDASAKARLQALREAEQLGDQPIARTYGYVWLDLAATRFALRALSAPNV